MTSRIGNLVVLFGAFMASSAALAKDVNLDHWLENDLLPYLGEQMVKHPRFKGENLMFVVFDDNAPVSVSSALALSLRDRLLDAALQNNGVRIGWRQGSVDLPGNEPIDCSRDDVHYYIGLELSRKIDGRYKINVRALDLVERSWVSGFGKSWRGRLDRMQQQALQRTQVDRFFLGARDVPFTLAQSDLLARHLAHELSCDLLRQTNGNYVVPTMVTGGDDDALDGTAELVSRNIAAQYAIELTHSEERANAELAGRALQIDGPLYQYWLSVTPNGKDNDLTTLSASAYILLPNAQLANNEPRGAALGNPDSTPVEKSPTSLSIRIADKSEIIGPLTVVNAASDQQCAAPNAAMHTSSSWSRGHRCSLLQASAHADAVVFFLEHQPQLGLVRLGGAECRLRTKASLVRRGDSLLFPIAWFRTAAGQMRETSDWIISPGIDTYYVVAVSDAQSARRLANHIDQLPIRCGESSRLGFTRNRLQTWLDEFALLAAQSASGIDWRALQLKDVY